MSPFPLLLLTASLRLLPRYDGVIFEITDPGGLDSGQHRITVEGHTLLVHLGREVYAPRQPLPLWVASLRCDSLGFRAVLDRTVTRVDYAYNADETVLLLFARSSEPAVLPALAWRGPPPMPDTLRVCVDSMALAAMEQGLLSPWLARFDCVAIDPGHGGRDPGAVGPAGSFEKHRNLEIALMVRDLLRIRLPEVRVVMTRTTDEYLSLGTRTRMANVNRADLFVSIHCNASTNRQARGMETFFLSRARTGDARAVELLENQVVELDDEPALPEDPLSFILADMAQNLFLSHSSTLAGMIQERLARAFPESPDRGVKQAGFYVLRGAYMPSVLVEVGFISNPEEERKLLSLDFRFKAAQAIVDAIVTYAEGANR